MKETCKECAHWNAPHMGMYDDEQWGSCLRHTNSNIENTKIVALCEGCVNVENRVKEFEFISHETFSCNQFKQTP